MPPATTISALPAQRASCAEHQRLHARAADLVDRGAADLLRDAGRQAACRAGAWPSPAGSTQPINTSLTSSGAMPARCSAGLIADAPSSGALRSLSTPWNAPIGVRAAPTTTTGSCWVIHLYPSGTQGSIETASPPPTSRVGDRGEHSRQHSYCSAGRQSIYPEIGSLRRVAFSSESILRRRTALNASRTSAGTSTPTSRSSIFTKSRRVVVQRVARRERGT